MANPTFSVMAEEDLTCPVCFELLRDPNTPKLLDCPHVCCAVCIQKMIEGGRRTVDCPECRQVTRIPAGGVTAMNIGLRLRSLAEKHEVHRTKKAQGMLPNQEPSDHTPATAETCPEHNITLDFYCKKCNIVGCSSCMMYKHKGSQHTVDEVQNIHTEQKLHMEVIFEQGANEIDECKQSVQKLRDLKECMEQSLDTQCENIYQQVELVTENVNKEGQTLINTLRKNEQSRIDHVQQQINHLQIQIQKQVGIMTTAKNTMETMEKHEYVAKHNKLAKTVSSAIGKGTKGKVNRNIAIGMTKYVYSKSPNMSGQLGKTLQLRELECKFVHEFGEFICANTIAIMPCGLLVISDFHGKQVYIYRQLKDGQYKRQSTLALSCKYTTGEPWGVAMTAEGKYLVARETHVEVYTPSGKYEGTLNFRHGDGKGNEHVSAHGIKVIPDGRIVIADWDRLMLTILSQEGTILDRLHISIQGPSQKHSNPGGWQHPRGAEWLIYAPNRLIWHNFGKTPEGSSPQSSNLGDNNGVNLPRIAVMPHGHIAVGNLIAGKVCVFDLESGKEVRAFDIPDALGLCYQEQTDCLLVGRCLPRIGYGDPKAGPGVIEQYCATTGRLVGCIAEGLCKPQDLTFTSDEMLAIADIQTVRIYKVV